MTRQAGYFSTFLLGVSLTAAGIAQTSGADGTAQPPQTIPAAHSSQPGAPVVQASGGNQSDDPDAYATGKPLAGQSKEGFWGHLNPFARKKWVSRQVDPIRDRTNELDQLQAKNANDIRDVDARSTAGINKALTSAKTADQHAADAHNLADQARRAANDASNRTSELSGTVSNLDQYKTVNTAPVPFAAGRTTLGPKAKAQLDEVAAKLSSEKGYIVEVQGYSRSGVQTSQAMADAVVRYLVTAHQVPVYRIYRTGLGNNTSNEVAGGKAISNGVVVSVMQNSLATMRPATSSELTAPGSTAVVGDNQAGNY